ncbi:MAG: hypothetical protein H6632_20660 [Anaerolineales bacterium]|nr:hypothetical protein [Anaerolineales bacterium]
MMNSELKKRLLQLHTQSEAGMFGSKAQAAAFEYKKLQDKGMQVFLKLIEDFYSTPKETEEDQMIANLSDLFCQLIIVVYREANFTQMLKLSPIFLIPSKKPQMGAGDACNKPNL